MSIPGRKAVLACLLVAWSAASRSQEPQPLPAAAADALFARAKAMCEREGGRLWGESLCGPILLVDPATRRVLASHADAEGRLQPAGDGVFAGTLPTDQNAAFTAFDWAGVRWTQLLWPLPGDAAQQDVLLAHELFHRIQPRLPIAAPEGGDNAHLDTVDGRYYLQLEWRALAQALQSSDAATRRQAIADALGFRAARYRLFPGAEAAETALELNEGLAEYTGVVTGTVSAEAATAAALRDLHDRAADASFVRAFAYASGPAYGLLLDALAPGWRAKLENGPNLAWLLRDAARIRETTAEALPEAAARHGGRELRAAEEAREHARLQRLRADRARFAEGPVVTLPLVHMKVQFDPRTLQPLDDLGTVYPTLRITDDWGVLEAEDGALLKPDWSAVVVVSPGAEAAPLAGPGWRLALLPGWRMVRGARAGDWTLESVGEAKAAGNAP
jgi:hypothetical protein